MCRYSKSLAAVVPYVQKSVTLIKGNAQSIFLCNPQKSLVNVCLTRIFLKSLLQKKVIAHFNNLGEESF